MGLLPRFWARVVIQDAGYKTPCLIWTGSKTAAGYGNLNLSKKYVLAHRIVFEARYGEIPNRIDGDRAVLDHLPSFANAECRVRRGLDRFLKATDQPRSVDDIDIQFPAIRCDGS